MSTVHSREQKTCKAPRIVFAERLSLVFAISCHMEKAEKLVGKAEDEEPEGVNPNSCIDTDGFFARSIGVLAG